MSSSRGSGAGSGVVVQPIPAASRKMVQSLKEIVNSSEAEIYAALKDCNMDPNEAVNRLLSQDPFREVKSKREKKKEGKDATEPRFHGANNNLSRSGKAGADRYLDCGGSTSYNSSESAPLPGKLAYKKENGSTPYASSLSSAPGISGNHRCRSPAGPSDSATAENKSSSFGHQSAWVGAPGKISMADIVKRGRPQNKAYNAPNSSHDSIPGLSMNASDHNLRYPADHASKDPDSGISSAQQIPINDGSSVEQPPTTKVISVPEYNVDSKQHLEASSVPSDSSKLRYEAEEDQENEADDIENPGENDVGADSLHQVPEDDSRGASLFETELYKDMGSYQHQAHDVHEVEEIGASVLSVTRSLQEISVEKDDAELPSEGYTPSVVIPDHLQVQNADCSHLNFGSFGSTMTAVYSSGTLKSIPVETNLEEQHSGADVPSVGHLETRSSEYYVEDNLGNASDGGLFPRSASTGNYDPSPSQQAEELKPENSETALGNQYPFPSSSPGYTFDDAQHLNATFSESSSQMQNLAPFSDVTLSYTNALPSNLSPANIDPSRDAELQYSPFHVMQSMLKYGNSVSSEISMSEALKTAGLSSTQPAPHAFSGTSVATGPPLPEHLAVHPYSQPALPLGPFANTIGYPFLPQSYAYMSSAFQQAFAGNSTYHQSLAALLPQFKNNTSATSLSQSAGMPSGYGAFGNTATVPGNFAMNPPAAPSGTALNYGDVVGSQYKDNSHLVSLQQNERSTMWHNSRTMSVVPSSTYHNYQGQPQQSSGFRQGRQPSQNYEALGYPNFYHSQTGMSLLDQQQNSRDGSLGSSQGQLPKQSQIWQNSY